MCRVMAVKYGIVWIVLVSASHRGSVLVQECNGEAFTYLVCMSADVLTTSSVAAPSSSVAQLPLNCGMSAPSFMWGDVEGTDFVQQISSAYDDVVHWRPNLFLGKVGKAFV